jgi:hypothetical protein
VSDVTRRRFLVSAATLLLGVAETATARGKALATPTVTVYKSPT